MKTWIRWWGLIAFVAVTGAIAVLWLLFIDVMVRRAVERAGASLAGAEVNVSSARLTVSPLGIALSGIQVTDPAAPSTNSVEIGRVAFSLDALNLLRRKIIIQEMSAVDLRFGTARTRPGFVVRREDKAVEKKKASSFTLPSLELPDLKKILDTESFLSVKVIDDAKADLQKTRDVWQQRVRELPNKATLDSYRSRLDKLNVSSKSSFKDLAGAASDAKKIKDDLDRDLANVTKARAALSVDLSATKDLVAKAEQSPLEDIRRIRDKYSLSPSGLQNLSQALFGDKIASWLDSGLVWYNRAVPLLSGSDEKKGAVKIARPLRGKGVDVRFPERAPLPDFLIRTVTASLRPDAGSFSGTIKNVTPDQDLIGAPLTFRFDGSGMQDVRAISLSGSLDHVRPSRFRDAITLQSSGHRIREMVLSGNQALPVTLGEGLMDMNVRGLRTMDGLKATLNLSFTSVRINAGKREGDGVMLASLRSALSRISSFTLSADVSGQPGSYEVKVSSDLDRVFRDAIGRMVQEQSATLEKELKAALQVRTDAKLKDLKASLVGLSSISGNIDSVQNQLNTLLQDAKQKAEGKIKVSR